MLIQWMQTLSTVDTVLLFSRCSRSSSCSLSRSSWLFSVAIVDEILSNRLGSLAKAGVQGELRRWIPACAGIVKVE